MSIAVTQSNQELEAVRVGIDLLSKSTNAHDLCRRIAHANFMDGFCHGVSVYLLNQRSALVQVAEYGVSNDFGGGEITAWDDNVLSQAVRSRKVATEATDSATLYALPIQHDDVITGVFVFNLSKKLPKPVFTDETVAMLSRLGGLFMETRGLSLRSNGATAVASNDDETISVQELTTRQIQIIKLIADGLTNAEIAKRVLLSESTVRQETIRIFRVLKCHNRAEAIVKAKANGIIEIAPPPANMS